MDNVNLLPENEYKEVEERRYLNPNLPVTETEDFITKFRDTQRGNTQEISQQTQALGTEVPSNLGGLTGANSYFTSRYQTPQTNSATQQLRTAAQASALNQAMANEEAMWKKRYQDAYRNYQKRSWDKANTPTTSGTQGGIDYKNNGELINSDYVITASNGDTVVAEPDGEGGTTGWVTYFHPDGTSERVFEGQTFTHNIGMSAGADQLSDILTGMYNYSINDGRELELGGWDENLVKDNEGNYYIWNKPSNTYTPVSGTQGKTSGGTRWWTK